MEVNAKPMPGALGFRVKSGWAMAVLLSGNSTSPRLLRCLPVLLSDPQVPGSKQPYHVALELPEKEGRRAVERLRKVVSRAAERSVAELLRQASEADCRVQAAALVVGSLVDPKFLHNEHIRAHALDGQLFRMVLEEALRGHKIECAVVVEKHAYAETAALLHTSAGHAKRMAADLGDTHEGAWRAEEKLAALAAWMALASGLRTGAQRKSVRK